MERPNQNIGGGKEPVHKIKVKMGRGKPYILHNKFAEPNQQQNQGEKKSLKLFLLTKH